MERLRAEELGGEMGTNDAPAREPKVLRRLQQLLFPVLTVLIGFGGLYLWFRMNQSADRAIHELATLGAKPSVAEIGILMSVGTLPPLLVMVAACVILSIGLGQIYTLVTKGFRQDRGEDPDRFRLAIQALLLAEGTPDQLTISQMRIVQRVLKG